MTAPTLLRLPWPRDPRFQVREDGAVFGPSGRELKPIVQRGRPGISVHKDGHWQRVQVSVIVCETFHGAKPNPKMHAAHEDGNAMNNAASNLSWKTAKENEADKVRHGTSMQGERHHQRKLTEADVLEIREKRAEGRLLWDLAAVYGVTQTTICDIAKRKTWRHI